jgi:hypothetical protein
MAAPLLEEVRDALIHASISQLAQPLDLDGTVPRSGLATRDEPGDAREIETV